MAGYIKSLLNMKPYRRTLQYIFCILFLYLGLPVSLVQANIIQTVAGSGFGQASSATNSVRLWLDASDINADGRTDIDLGNFVNDTWRDKSGYGVNFMRSATRNVPDIVRTAGLIGVDFERDSSHKDRLVANRALFNGSISEYSVFAVLNKESNANSTLFNLNPSGGRLLVHVPEGGAPAQVRFDAGAQANRLSASFAGTNTGERYIWNFVNSVANSRQQIYRSGSELASDATGHTINFPNNSRAVIGTESETYTADYFEDGILHEFIVFGRDLNSAEQLLIENYLAAKWNLNNIVRDIFPEPDRNFVHDIAGIGRIDASNIVTATTSARVDVTSTPSGGDQLLNSNDSFFMLGHDNGVRNSMRMVTGYALADRTWYGASTGTDGTVGTNNKIRLVFPVEQIGLGVSNPTNASGWQLLATTTLGNSFAQIAAGGTSYNAASRTVTVELDADQLHERYFTLAALGPAIIPTIAPAGQQNVAYSYTLTNLGGAVSITGGCSVRSGVLPSGFSLTRSGNTCQFVASRPTQVGATTLLVRALNSDGVNDIWVTLVILPETNRVNDLVTTIAGDGFGTSQSNQLRLWLDGGDINGDGHFNNHGTNLSQFGGWQDLSGFGLDLFNSGISGTVLPTIVPETQALSGVDFERDSTHVLTSSAPLIQGNQGELSIFAVINKDSEANSTLFNLNAGGNRVLAHVPEVAGGNSLVRFDVNGQSGAQRVSGNWGASTGVRYVWNFVNSVSQNQQRVYRSGNQIANDATGEQVNFVASGRVVMGADETTSPNFAYLEDAIVHEFIIFNRYLNDAERRLMDNYLAAKWDIDNLATDIYNEPSREFTREIGGIGRINASNILNESGSGGLKISAQITGNHLLATDGNFFVVGHDNSAFVGHRPVGGNYANRNWYGDSAGTNGFVDGGDRITMEFMITDLGFAFTDVTTPTEGWSLVVGNDIRSLAVANVVGIYNTMTQSVSFVIDADLLNDRYFTLNLPVRLLFAIIPNSPQEGSNAQISVVASQPVQRLVEVTVNRIGGNATNGVDYILANNVIRLQQGNQTASIPIQIQQDNIYENDETLRFAPVVTLGSAIVRQSSASMRIVEDDGRPRAGITAGNTLMESAGNFSMNISLDRATTQDVTIMLNKEGSAVIGDACADEGVDYVLASTQVVIVAGATMQTIDGTVCDDRFVDPSDIIRVVIQGVSGGGVLISPTIPAANITIADNDFPNINLSTTSLSIDENGGTGMFQVSLTSRPADDVQLLLSILDAGELILSNTALNFTSQSWNTSQTIILTGVDDFDPLPDQTTVQISVNLDDTLTTDMSYRLGLGSTVTVSVIMPTDESPGILVSSTTVTIVEGSTGLLGIRLASRPESAVAIDIATVDTAQATVEQEFLVFTVSNWNSTQNIVINSVEDNVQVALEVTTMQVSVSPGSDPVFGTLSPVLIPLIFEDNDSAAVIMNNRRNLLELSAPENSTAQVAVRLQTQPVAMVRIDLTSSIMEEATVSPSQLTFTQADWDVEQNFIVTLLDDNVVSADRSTITLAIMTGDTVYASLTPAVNVNIVDDELATLIISSPTINMIEASTRAVMVALSSTPRSDVTLQAISLDTNVLTVSPTSIAIDESVATVPNVFTIQAVDNDLSGDTTASIRFAFSATSDMAYRAVQSIARVNVMDEDGANIVLSTNTVVLGEGSTLVYTVSLSSRPSSAVLVMLDNIPQRMSVSTRMLSFNTENALTTQSIIIQSAEDNIYRGNITSQINHRVVSAADAFSEAQPNRLTVGVVDNDVPVASIRSSSDPASSLVQLLEGNTTNLDIFLSNQSIFDTQVNLAQTGSADFGVDYILPAQVAVLRGTTGSSFVFTARMDNLYENNEEVIVSIDSVSQGGIIDATASSLRVSLSNIDALPILSISATPTRISETGNTRIRISLNLLSAVSDVNFRLSYMGMAVETDTAAEDNDYRVAVTNIDTATPGQGSMNLTIGSGQLERSVILQAISDTDTDNDSVLFEISNVTGANLSATMSTVAISISEDFNPPIPGGGLIISSYTQTTAMAMWNNSSDDRTTASQFRYRLYVATTTFSATDLSDIQSVVNQARHSFIVNDAPQDNNTQYTMTGLLPDHRYYVTLVVLDFAGNQVLYTTSGISFTTALAVDADNDGLADSLTAADGSATDGDNDNISDDVETYIRSRDAALTDVTHITDLNNNLIPDVVEVRYGLPVNQLTAHDVLGRDATRPRIVIPSAEIRRVSSGFESGIFSMVTAMDSSTPIDVVAYLKRSDCDTSVMPANYETSCERVSVGNTLILRSGTNRLWWIAQDDSGNWPSGGASSQTVLLVPQLEFYPNIAVLSNTTYRVTAVLSGNLIDPTRELRVPITVTADDTSSQLTMGSTASVVFSPGHLQGSLEVVSGETTGTQRFNLNILQSPFVRNNVNFDVQTERVTVGGKNIFQAQVRSNNLDPLVNINITQSSRSVTTVSTLNTSPVWVTAEVINMPANQVTYNWQQTDNAITVPSPSTAASSFVIAPNNLNAGLYNIVLQASRGTTNSITIHTALQVVAAPNLVAGRDTDGDSVLDIDEGIVDVDGDRIPDYIDTLNNNAHILQSRRSANSDIPDARQYVLKTVTNHRLRLGMVALSISSFASGTNYVSGVSLDNIAMAGNRGNRALNSSHNAPNSAVGIYDWEILYTSDSYERVRVSIPLLQPAPVNPQTRVYFADMGWRDFDASAGDSVLSVLGSPGLCPAAEAADWQMAMPLQAGHNCILISVRDGAANDTDGMANGIVAHTVGIAGLVDNSVTASGRISQWMLLGCFLMMIIRRLGRKNIKRVQ